MNLVDRAKSLMTPFLTQICRTLRRQVAGRLSEEQTFFGLTGDYSSWQEALAASTGYDCDLILAKTKAALLQVKRGAAAHERDSVLFDEIQYSWPLLAGLLWAAARQRGELNVLDFGGSLGSTYFQNRHFLQKLPEVRWNIVEQPSYVKVGRELFATEELHFYPDLATCLANTRPKVVLLSSVLQYLESPYTILQEIFRLPCDQIILDRTPFWDGSTDRLCVQRVPPSIYPASYPSWIFSRPRFYDFIGPDWQVMVAFDNPDNLAGPVDFSYQGMIIVPGADLS